MQELIDKYYKEFKGLPSNRAIVRNKTPNDAFAIVVLKILYGKILDLTFDKDHISDIAKYVIAPPDNGIDIFITKGDEDDPSFDVIQVKNKKMSENDLRTAIEDMQRTISDYCSSALEVKSENCREILSNSSLDANNKKNCQYYVVHIGEVKEFTGIKDFEHILTLSDLQTIAESKQDKVEEDILSVTSPDQLMKFGEKSDNQSAVVCSVNAHQLATLNNKYYSTEIGRNILFGHNLREFLNQKRSKSFRGIMNTIEGCPEKFWYYNNGITIIAEDVSIRKNTKGIVDGVKLKRFSIVNGAQTTSSLGLILQQAKRDRNKLLEDSLKKAFVIVRVLKVRDSDTENAIAIYNNTQTPITSRDMVSNNIEQKKLYDILIDTTYPTIYMEIRTGSKLPQNFNKLFLHRRTTNVLLAQLAYAGFYLEPFKAKDKKATLFNNEYGQTVYTMNETYHQIFHYDETNENQCGILFRKNKSEIDELLFSHQLYKEGKAYLRRSFQARLEDQKNILNQADDDQRSEIQKRIDNISAMYETVGVCMFYFITTYYEFMGQFGTLFKDKRYDFDKFYSDKEYRNKMAKEMADFFLMKTIQVLQKTAMKNGKNNINNWVRSSQCEKVFLTELRDLINYDPSCKVNYSNLMNTYKTVKL